MNRERERNKKMASLTLKYLKRPSKIFIFARKTIDVNGDM